MINLIITDDHPLMIEGIKTALSMATEINVIAKENCSNKIAESLKISTSSVKTYRERLMMKAGVGSSAGLVYWAMKNKLLE